MKISLRCENCRNYSPVVPKPQLGIAVAECACGVRVVQAICPMCNGSGYAGLTPCRCDLGLDPRRTVTYPDEPGGSKQEAPRFGDVIVARSTAKRNQRRK